MTIVIVGRRNVKLEHQAEAFDLLKRLRSKAVLQSGYLSGQTLFSANQSGSHMVISKWRSIKDWRTWEVSEERRELLAQMEHVLETSPTTEIYVESISQPPEGT